MDVGFVYKWTNTVTGCWYIGSHSGNIDDGYIGSGKMFRYAINKYGIDNFVREIMYIGNNYRAEEEKILMQLDAVNNLMSYNLKNNAVGGAMYGIINGNYKKPRPKHVIDAMVAACKKIKDETGYGPQKGRKLSNEHRYKISQYAKTRIGEKNAFYGKKHSDKSRKQMSLTLKQTFILQKPVNSLITIIDNVEYSDILLAAIAIGVKYTTLRWRLNSENKKYATMYLKNKPKHLDGTFINSLNDGD